MINTIMKLKENRHGKAEIDELFRITHSFKGMSATMGYTKTEHLSHKTEDVLYEVRDGRLELDDELLSTIGRVYVILITIMDTVSDTGSDEEFSDEEIENVIKELESYLPQNENKKESTAVMDSGKIAELFEDGKVVKVIVVTIDSKCQFKGVRGYMVINSLENNIEMLMTIPSKAELEIGNCESDKLYIMCRFDENIADGIEQRIVSVSEIVNVEIFEADSYNDIQQMIGLNEEVRPAVVEEVVVPEDFLNEIEEYSAVIKNEISKTLERIDMELVDIIYAESKSIAVDNVISVMNKYWSWLITYMEKKANK
jgi:two-component system chemotaxis sensor kinase CheA